MSWHLSEVPFSRARSPSVWPLPLQHSFQQKSSSAWWLSWDCGREAPDAPSGRWDINPGFLHLLEVLGERVDLQAIELEQDKEAPPTSFFVQEFPLSSHTLLSPNYPSELGQRPQESPRDGEGRGQIFLFQLLFSEYFRLGVVQLSPLLWAVGGEVQM